MPCTTRFKRAKKAGESLCLRWLMFTKSPYGIRSFQHYRLKRSKMLHYKQEIPAMTDLLVPYSSGGLGPLCQPSYVEQAVKASLWQLLQKELVAYLLGRDGHWLFLQDLGKTRSLALRHWEEILKEALKTFPNVYQRPRH